MQVLTTNTILLSITSDKEGDLLLVIIFVILVSTLGMKILQYNRAKIKNKIKKSIHQYYFSFQ